LGWAKRRGSGNAVRVERRGREGRVPGREREAGLSLEHATGSGTKAGEKKKKGGGRRGGQTPRGTGGKGGERPVAGERCKSQKSRGEELSLIPLVSNTKGEERRKVLRPLGHPFIPSRVCAREGVLHGPRGYGGGRQVSLCR